MGASCSGVYRNVRFKLGYIVFESFRVPDMESGAASVYGEAKGEYTTQLCVFLLNPLQRWFLNLFEIARSEESEKRKVLKHFQDLLSQIPEWNIDKVARETTKIADESGCDYLEDLLTAVFIAHTKVLSAIRIGSSKNKSIQITVPKLEHFLHRCLSESARRVWSNVYLFAEGIPSLEKQKNLRQLESILSDCIQQAVRGLLPVKNLLRDYLTEAAAADVTADVEEDEEAILAAAPVTPSDAATPSDATPATSSEPSLATAATPSAAAAATPATVVEGLLSTEPIKREEALVDPPLLPLPLPLPPTTQVPEILVDTEKARVHFSEFNTVFKDGATEVIPSETIEEEEEDEDDFPLKIHDEIQTLGFDDYEQVDTRPPSPLAYEVLQ